MSTAPSLSPLFPHTLFLGNSKIQVVAELPASPKFGRRLISLVPMDETEGWEHNPEIRTRPAALQALAERIRDVGQLVPGAVVKFRDKKGNTRYKVVDGHRRRAILTQGGADFFEAVFYPDVEMGTDLFGVLFETVNVGTRPPGIRERIWLALMDESAAAGLEACRIADEISGALGDTALEKFIEAGCPRQAFNNAKSAFRQCKDRQLVKGDRSSYDKFISNCVVWQIEQSEQQALKLYLTQISAVAAESVKKNGTLGPASKKLCTNLMAFIDNAQPIPRPKTAPEPRFEDDDEEE